MQVVLHQAQQGAQGQRAVRGLLGLDLGRDLAQGGRGAGARRDGRHDHLHRVPRQLHWGQRGR